MKIHAAGWKQIRCAFSTARTAALARSCAGAPTLAAHLDEESRVHFAAVEAGLRALGIGYEINAKLVRGLDYYTRTVFEWTTDRLGAQGTVCAGGRYDGLVAQLGGGDTPAVGFAMGIERIVQLCKTVAIPAGFAENHAPHAYLCWLGDTAYVPALRLADELRAAAGPLRVVMNAGGGNLKAQLKRADRSGARVALILGEQELQAGQCQIKHLREPGEQQSVALGEVRGFLLGRVGNGQ